MSLKEKLQQDEPNEVACDVLTRILDQPGSVNALMQAIPDNWEHRCIRDGCNPTKRDFVFAWLWDLMNT